MYLPTPEILNGHVKPVPECEWCLSKDIKDSRVYPIEVRFKDKTTEIIHEEFACSNGHSWRVSG